MRGEGKGKVVAGRGRGRGGGDNSIQPLSATALGDAVGVRGEIRAVFQACTGWEGVADPPGVAGLLELELFRPGERVVCRVFFLQSFVENRNIVWAVAGREGEGRAGRGGGELG